MIDNDKSIIIEKNIKTIVKYIKDYYNKNVYLETIELKEYYGMYNIKNKSVK